jgi:4-hydroxybenzoyl-CoA thioesterase
VYERAVRFEDVDAAQILFFSRFLNYCHEAMEAMLAPLEGGYPALIVERKLGLPAVHVDIEYKAPLRFGDVARIEVTVEKIGRSSAAIRYDLRRTRDDVHVATVHHTVVLSDLTVLKSTPMPDDVRAALTQHLERRAPSP